MQNMSHSSCEFSESYYPVKPTTEELSVADRNENPALASIAGNLAVGACHVTGTDSSNILNEPDFILEDKQLFTELKKTKLENLIELEVDPSERGAIRKLLNHSVLSPEEQIELTIKANRGDKESKDKLILHTMRWIAVCAKKRHMNRGLTFSELLIEGSIGCARAIEKFDPERGFHFVTYATWWIDQAMRRAIENTGSTIRLPNNLHCEANNLFKEKDRFIQQNGYPPSLQELSSITGMSIKKCMEISRTKSVSSLDAALPSFKGSVSLHELVADTEVDVEADALNNIQAKEILALLDLLDETDALIVKLRYGQIDGICHEYDDIASRVGLKTTRVKYILDKSYKTLKKLYDSQTAEYRVGRHWSEIEW